MKLRGAVIIKAINEQQFEYLQITMKSAAKGLSALTNFKQYGNQLYEILERANEPLLVMIMGEFKTGKSTFINALLEEEIVTSDVTPATAVVTVIRYGPDRKAIAHFHDGRSQEYSLLELRNITAEGDNSKKELRRSIKYVEIFLAKEILKKMTFVDTPGLNVDNEDHIIATKEIMHKADVILWVFACGKAASRSEIVAIEELSERLRPIAIINKIDEIDEEEEKPDDIISDLKCKLNNKVREVIGVSSLFALNGKLNNDAEKLRLSRWSALMTSLERKVLDNINDYKLNFILEELIEYFGIADKENTAINNELRNNPNLIKDKKKFDVLRMENSVFKEIISELIIYVRPLCELEAEDGNTVAQLFLGRIYYEGYGVGKNPDKAKKWIELAAEKGVAYAQALLGACYILGDIFDKDYNQGRQWLEAAAAQGEADGFNGLGYLYSETELADGIKATYWYKKAAESGCDNAQNWMGHVYQKGLYGTEVDYNTAVSYYEKAAEQGYSGGQYNLGVMYLECEAIGINREKAKYWFEKAARQEGENELGIANARFYLAQLYYQEQNYYNTIFWLEKAIERDVPEAYFGLAMMYYKGNGVGADEQKAFKLLQKAAEQGHGEAQNNLGFVCQDGRGTAVNYSQAKYWYEQASEQGNIDAQNNLGYLHEEGLGTAVNYVQAKYWYEKAAEHGHADAQNNLGSLYQDGKGTAVNYAQAKYWYEKAAEQEHADAQNNLGYMYYYGHGTTVDYKKAQHWFRQAAEQGFATAQVWLGRMFEEGKGTSQSIAQAKLWYNKAIEQGNEDAKFCLANLESKAEENYSEMTSSTVTTTMAKQSNWFETYIVVMFITMVIAPPISGMMFAGLLIICFFKYITK